ncbi:hypothetical protein PIB30_003594 [Stylosanthes scabra]|uniref:Uncharacterized protein n=1 Tax=Stylosanthes scabra TaxID=79078 RepID=A0ABU6Y1H8_9FABA|nr:hypothetical protein [Stylosanthes scabra]
MLVCPKSEMGAPTVAKESTIFLICNSLRGEKGVQTTPCFMAKGASKNSMLERRFHGGKEPRIDCMIFNSPILAVQVDSDHRLLQPWICFRRTLLIPCKVYEL